MERHGPFIAIVVMMCLTAAYLTSTTPHKMFTWGPPGTAERMNRQYYPSGQFGGAYGQPQGFNGYQQNGLQGYGQPYYPPQQFVQ